jgi:hypothetical protein
MTMLDFNDTTERPVTVALGYAARGWPVFPCNPLTKAPLTEHGFKEASLEPLKIRSWWAKSPNAMIGIPTGPVAGFWVLDIDQDKAKGKNGAAGLAAMGHDLSELMDTVVANTATGGYHCLFRYDPARPVTNARGKLPKDVDVRGAGGYIVAAGSTKADGGQYLWLNPPDENEIEAAPAWLYEIIQGSADPLDFNGAKVPVSPTERVQKIAPGTWHENTRDLVARMVREGASDETIEAIAPRFTEPGFGHQQTIREFLSHARTAREKWGYQPRPEPAPADPGDVFRVMTIDELATLKPPEWRIDGIFPVYGSSTIYGAYESYKTFVALDMLLSLAAGRPWMGREMKPCAVLYVAGEGQHGLAQRILGWCEAKNDGARPADFLLLPEAIAIPDRGNLDKLLRTVDALPAGAGVVALDTITRMSGGGSLNDEKDMQQYVLGMDRLRRHTGGHIMNVGHSGKDKEKGLLGSIVLPAAMETIICVERTGDALKLVNSNPKGKQKDGPNFPDIALRTQVSRFRQADEEASTLVLMPDENPVREAAQKGPAKPQGANQQTIMAALKKAKGEPLGVTRLAGMTGLENARIAEATSSLVAKGLVHEVGEEGARRWVLP